MLILYNKFFKNDYLKKIIRIYKIKNCSKLKKNDLLKKINILKACYYIQNFYRKKIMGEDLCPITYDNLKYPFVSLKNGNKFRYYSLDGILNYYNTSKDFRDPFTKKNLDENKIKEINILAKYYKKKQINNKSNNIQNRTEMLTILCCLNDTINNIMRTEVLTYEYMNNFAIPQLLTYIYYLVIRYRTYTRSITEHYIDILESHIDINKYFIISHIISFMIDENI